MRRGARWGSWSSPAGSAVEILDEQNRDRLPDLVGLRFARMLADPFSFYRGAAAVMAADLAGGPSSGIEVMCSGDAHLANFGVYPGPQRSVLVDLNDFDETGATPFEWDLKRLLTSAPSRPETWTFSSLIIRCRTSPFASSASCHAKLLE